jgi:hypothetical protein
MKYTPANGQFGEALTLFRPQVALQLQRVHPRNNEGLHTINMELAQAENFRADWENKLTVQVTMSELPKLAAVLVGLVPSVVNRYHGERNNHGYEVINTAESRVWSAFAPGGKRFFNFTPDEAFWLADFVLDALAANTRTTSTTDLMNLLRQTVARP